MSLGAFLTGCFLLLSDCCDKFRAIKRPLFARVYPKSRLLYTVSMFVDTHAIIFSPSFYKANLLSLICFNLRKFITIGFRIYVYQENWLFQTYMHTIYTASIFYRKLTNRIFFDIPEGAAVARRTLASCRSTRTGSRCRPRASPLPPPTTTTKTTRPLARQPSNSPTRTPLTQPHPISSSNPSSNSSSISSNRIRGTEVGRTTGRYRRGSPRCRCRCRAWRATGGRTASTRCRSPPRPCSISSSSTRLPL